MIDIRSQVASVVDARENDVEFFGKKLQCYADTVDGRSVNGQPPLLQVRDTKRSLGGTVAAAGHPHRWRDDSDRAKGFEHTVERIEAYCIDSVVIGEQNAHYFQDSAGFLRACAKRMTRLEPLRFAKPKGEILRAVPVIFICGGARSGKSRKAMELALRIAERPGFIATAEVLDEEMAERVARHQLERDSRFDTIEAPLDVASALSVLASRDAIVVDCLTLWLSNLMLGEALDLEAEFERLLVAIGESSSTVILVSNEVGCGIVPENALARRFRDEMGRLNARVAACADEVYWMVCGCELRMK